MQRKVLTNVSAFKRTDNRWCGVVWYMDEHGERKRNTGLRTGKLMGSLNSDIDLECKTLTFGRR